MKIAVLKESAPGETRCAATPETVKKFAALGAEVAVEAGAGEDGGHVGGDAGGAVAGVAADDDGGAGVEALRQAGRDASGEGAVHAAGTGSEGAADAGGAELQPLPERLLEVGGVAVVEPALDLCASGRIGVVGQPRTRRGGRRVLRHGRLPTMPRWRPWPASPGCSTTFRSPSRSSTTRR